VSRPTPWPKAADKAVTAHAWFRGRPESGLPVFEIDGKAFLAWLDGRDPATEYQYTHPTECLLAQFTGCELGAFTIKTTKGINLLPDWLHDVAQEVPRTFGGAADRVRRLV
jgi:hypothetical protein